MKRFTRINENVNIKETGSGRYITISIDNDAVFNDIKDKPSSVSSGSNVLVLIGDKIVISLIADYNEKISHSDDSAGIEREYNTRLGYVNKINGYFNDGYTVVFVVKKYMST